jgi:hypothetical protein
MCHQQGRRTQLELVQALDILHRGRPQQRRRVRLRARERLDIQFQGSAAEQLGQHHGCDGRIGSLPQQRRLQRSIQGPQVLQEADVGPAFDLAMQQAGHEGAAFDTPVQGRSARLETLGQRKLWRGQGAHRRRHVSSRPATAAVATPGTAMSRCLPRLHRGRRLRDGHLQVPRRRQRSSKRHIASLQASQCVSSTRTSGCTNTRNRCSKVAA